MLYEMAKLGRVWKTFLLQDLRESSALDSLSSFKYIRFLFESDMCDIFLKIITLFQVFD